jgi:hypothetical protein
MAKAAIDRGSEVDIETGLRLEEAYYAQVRRPGLGLRDHSFILT